MADFNVKPHDLTEFYTIKGASNLVNMSSHAAIIGNGVQHASGQGIVSNGLSFDGSGYVSYVAQAITKAPTVTVDVTSPFLLTEFQTRGTKYPSGENQDAIEDEGGNRNDWIEIQNVSDSEQSLSGWRLIDSTPTTYTIPEGVTIPAGGFAIVFADDTPSPSSGLHANFGLKGQGEELKLLRPVGNDTPATYYAIQSSANFIPECIYDVSFGIVKRGANWFEGFFNASPGETNQGIGRRQPMELGSADFTISLWLKTSSNNVALLSKSDTNGTFDTGEKQLYLDGNGRVRYIVKDGANTRTIAGTTAITNGQWHHVAIVFHPDSVASTRKVYVDGNDDTDSGATDYSNTGSADATGSGVRLLLGYAASTQDATNFSGVLDEVAIWARTLSAAEITNIYSAGIQHIGVDTRAEIPTGLLFHAPMDVFLTPKTDSKYRQAYNIIHNP